MLTPNSKGMFIVSLLFCNHLAGGTETETDCVRLNVFLLSYGSLCSGPRPHSAVGWSVVCD